MANVKFKTTLKLDRVLVDYAGEPIMDERRQEQTAGKLLARQLGNQLGVKDELKIGKYNRWASVLWTGQPLELEPEDFEEFKEFVIKRAELSVISAGPIIDMINEQHEAQKKRAAKKA